MKSIALSRYIGTITMDIQISDAALFRKAMEALKDFLPQAQMQISRDGIRVRGMDVSHVGFVDYFLSAKDCDAIRVGSDSVVGINTTILSRILAGASDKLTIAEEGDHLKIAFRTDGRAASFEVPTLSLDMDAVELPDMAYGATVKAKASDLSSVIKDLSMFGDMVNLTLNEEGFHVKAEGDVGKGTMTLEPTEDREMALENEPVSGSFAMKYLQQIMKSCSSLSPNMEIAFDPSYPLRVSAQFGKESHFVAYLAPKIDQD